MLGATSKNSQATTISWADLDYKPNNGGKAAKEGAISSWGMAPYSPPTASEYVNRDPHAYHRLTDGEETKAPTLKEVIVVSAENDNPQRTLPRAGEARRPVVTTPAESDSGCGGACIFITSLAAGALFGYGTYAILAQNNVTNLPAMWGASAGAGTLGFLCVACFLSADDKTKKSMMECLEIIVCVCQVLESCA